MGTPSRRLLALLLAAGLLAAPPLARGQQISNPDLYGKSLEVAAKALEIFGPAGSREDLSRVADIGYRLAERTHFDRFPFTFHIVEMAAPNAFALPGGHIFVTSGMLELGVDDDMLAGLLGHEVAHVVYEHGTKMQRRATLLNLLSQAVLVGVLVGARDSRRPSTQAPYDPRVRYPDRTGELVQGTAATGIIVSELLLRGYSREFEREADDEGQRLAAGAGFDPGGLTRLMELMDLRLPQSKEYGYWQTHPFFEDRVSAAQSRAALLKQQPAPAVDAYRLRTQATLLTYLEQGKPPAGTGDLLKAEALTAWPKGPKAEEIRLEKLGRLRSEELAETPLARDYGALTRAFREELAEVRRLDPESKLVAELETQLADLEQQSRDYYPQAAGVVRRGVYETPFLETFLSNYPDAPEVPQVALALGDAYSRLGNQTEAVEHYLEAWGAAPESAEGQRALTGLKNLIPFLHSLAALQQLAAQEEDGELQGLARGRLDKIAGGFDDLALGAEYLRRFPDGDYAPAVTARLNSLADELYTEVVLYQGVGDSVKALDRINRILTHAPTSPAADRLRQQASVAEG